MHYRIAQETFVPTVLPDNVVPLNREPYDVGKESEKLRLSTARLTEVTADVCTLRQLLESTLDDAQREVFRDIAAKESLQSRLISEVEIQMRQLARNRGSRG